MDGQVLVVRWMVMLLVVVSKWLGKLILTSFPMLSLSYSKLYLPINRYVYGL